MTCAAIKIKGFTLIELMVVIGIVGLLVAILVPVLNQSRSKGRELACASNLRQWGLAWSMYCNDYRGFPPARGPNLADLAKPTSPYWFGALARYIRSPAVMQCPATTEASLPFDQTKLATSALGGAKRPWVLWRQADQMTITGGYGYNTYWYSDSYMAVWSSSFALRDWKTSARGKADRGPILMDMSSWEGAEAASDRWPYDLDTGQWGPTNYSYQIIARHGGKQRGINMLFSDGGVRFTRLASVYAVPYYVGHIPETRWEAAGY